MKKIFQILAALLFIGFSATAQRVVTGTITEKDGSPIPGVNVVVKGTTIGTQTDGSGVFSLQVPAGANTLVMSFLGYTTAEADIPTSNVLNVTMEAAASQLSEVVISVGSRNTQRTITDAPIPIDIIGAADLKATGQQTFDKALQYRVPSFNTVMTPVNDATSLLDPYEIRNMGPSRTLILINGKRKNTSSLIYIQTSPGRGETGADISAIPVDAIKRVEILRDGASAQYGSDAIAGVMNIILKDRYDYGSFNINAGVTGKGDGGYYGVSLNNGANLGEKGFVNYTIDLSDRSLANRPGTVDAQGDANDFGASLSTVQAFLAKYPDAGNINGSPATSAAKFLINAGVDLGKNTQLYGNVAYVYKKVNSFANYRTPYWRPTDYGLLTPAGQTYVGYVPNFIGDLNDYNGTVGLKTESNGWKTDVSFTTGGNQQVYTVSNSINRGLKENSPTFFHTGGYGFSHNVGNLDITKSILDNLVLGIGAEYRAESFTIMAGDTASNGKAGTADSFPGIPTTSAGNFTRFNFGAYVDLGWDVSKDFLINGTVRQEKYSDFGNAFVYKVSSRYKLADDKFVIRGSVSSGFRAPSLHQIYEQLSQASFVPGQGIQIKGLVNNVSPAAFLLGVPKLQPETSTNITLGLGFNPTKNFSVTLDYYNIALKNRIILSSNIAPGGIPASANLDKILSNAGIVGVSFFTNGINTTTSGIDFVSSYRNLLVGSGKLSLNLAGNYTLTSGLDGGLTGGVINPKLISDAGQSVFDATQQSLLLTSRPKFKIIGGGDYYIGKFGFNLNGTVFGPATFHQDGIDANLNTEFDTKIVFDLGASWKITKDIILAVNVNNILNTIPSWHYVSLNSKGDALIGNAAGLKDITNAITFNGRYAITTYDGSHFSQLGTIFDTRLTFKF